MTIGEEGKNGTRTFTLEEAQTIIDVFLGEGYTELDTARAYGKGTTEEYLSKLNLGNATIDTKVFPFTPGDHKPEKLRETFKASLAALGRSKVRVLYLHAPDHSVPFEETVGEINKLYQEGLFEIFGLSNFAAWEVAEIVGICKANDWVLPGIYQAIYNGITRSIEPELVPCLRKYNIRLVIYNPLAGGFFAGKLTSVTDEGEKGGRFHPVSGLGPRYRARYLKNAYLSALEGLKPVAEKHGLRLTEIALRWVQHHSILKPEDGVILGASSAAQLRQNLEDSAKGPLAQEVVEAVDKAWADVGLACAPYFI
ncbi:Aldo/keto reductase [Cantharellus anzutake]|uniref:Aldo/keto reductase n=1 Tax=Cantharellus anzutake TaxID=1750568 RepID=UPI0019042F3C|nr:Aldo/keto reductase [Cantharellus anzutake]KAF8344214.1 Aldo/keto reductase [Cantharellus anzutake]